MAGRGSRLRPQTLITPKPLVPIAGISILNQLVSDTIKLVDEPIDEMVFHGARSEYYFQQTYMLS